MAEKRVVIEHPKTGERYGIPLADFDKMPEEKTFKDLGFKILMNEDQSPFEPPDKPKAAARPGGDEG